jgi:outer membrane murein-binding lipoprotein Lpp
MPALRSVLSALALALLLLHGGVAHARATPLRHSSSLRTMAADWADLQRDAPRARVSARPSSAFLLAHRGFGPQGPVVRPRLVSPRGMIIAGSVVFGATYSLALFTSLVAADSGMDGAVLYAIPVVGPAGWGLGYGVRSSMPRTSTALHLLWSGGQAAGLAMLISGLCND